ncbi:hypothetical protein HXT51_06540 [Gardnerella sp. KA00255]
MDFMQEESHSIIMKSCAIFASAAAVLCMATIIPANANESKSSFNTASESKNKSEKNLLKKVLLLPHSSRIGRVSLRNARKLMVLRA